MEALASLLPHASRILAEECRAESTEVNDSDYFDRYFTPPYRPATCRTQPSSGIWNLLGGELAAGRKCQETFDHPNEQMQLKALKKGTRHIDQKIDGRNLIDFLSAGLSLESSDKDFRSTTLRLRSAWLADLLWHCDPWEGPDVAVFVGRFPHPSVLDHCLNLFKNRAENAIGQGTPGLGQTLLKELAAVWNKQATEWLLGD